MKNKKGTGIVSFFNLYEKVGIVGLSGAGKTTLVIAHRLSTLRNMDRIVVIKNGKIMESGSHKQLLRSGGVYRKLWDMQTGGSIGE